MGRKAIELFDRMPRDLINDRTSVCVLNACSHSGLLDDARRIFEKISTKTEMVYTAMVSETSIRSIDPTDRQVDCCSRVAAFDEAKELLQQYEMKHSPSLSMHSESSSVLFRRD